MVINISHIDNVWYFGFLLAIFLRWSVSQFPYSGAGTPPMYGDYEAQRHWMEITVNLDVKEWYANTTNNDLLYWGLDYPPLTAYHSYINGKIAEYVNKSWIQLHTSRGIESYHHKLFMRSTVLVVDLIIFFTGTLFYWINVSRPRKQRDKAIAAVMTLIYPGVILIDHGHFQYNCVSLGLVIWALIFIINGHDIIGAMSFCLALNYKQMSLYYAFPFFFFFLGKISQLPKKQMFIKFISLSFAVVLTFIINWLPYISSYETFIQVLRRLFPFNRGIYEDKVANFWCTFSVIIKFKNFVPQSIMPMISAFITLIGLIPSNFHLFKNPDLKSFYYALINSSLIFFLFSYQVHEKTILFVAIPFLLLIEEHPLLTIWFVVISTFSLFPLLIKDGLTIPFYALTTFYLCSFFNAFGEIGDELLYSFKKKEIKSVMFLGSMFGCLVLSIASLCVTPPQKYPDIHSVLNAIYSFLHFVFFSVELHYLQLGKSFKLSNYQYKPVIKQMTKLKKK